MNKDQVGKMLASEGFSWKDMIVFTMDNYVKETVADMVEVGALPELTKEEQDAVTGFLYHQLRGAIDFPLS